MTSVPLLYSAPSPAKRESYLPKYAYRESPASCETKQLPRYHDPATSHKMNVFHSISSFLRKQKKVPDKGDQQVPKRATERVEGPAHVTHKKVEEESIEGSEGSEGSDENKEDIAFVRSTFRQSVKRAIGWRKSQRKAVNKRKKENIQNSKLLIGGGQDNDNEGESEFYDDTELDVVVVTDGAVPDDPQAGTSAKSRIPKRRQSVKRPAVSLKSSGFFSQSVASKRSDGGRPVTARKNKASELREEATKKKLESTPAQSIAVPIPVPVPARRKPRASFHTKKGISRRPLQVHKKEQHIKPAENKASQLRAKKHQEETAEEETKQKTDSKQTEAKVSDKFTSVGVKTPAPTSENKDPFSYLTNSFRDSAPLIRTSNSDYKIKSLVNDSLSSSSVRTSGRAIKAVPQKPVRTKIPSASSTNLSSTPTRTMPTPPITSLSQTSVENHTRKFSGRSEKTVPTSIPKRNFSPTQGPSKELLFIPLDSVSLPLPGEKNKIDEVKRKRKIQRPVSNIFDGGAGDLPVRNVHRQLHADDSDTTFTVHVNKTPTSTPKQKTPRTPRIPVSSLVSKTPVSSSVPSNARLSPRANSDVCVKNRAKPRQVQNLSSSTFVRMNSLESARQSKKNNPAISRLSESNSFNSEGSDQENSCSFDSCRSFEDDDGVFKTSSSPIPCESPRLRETKIKLPSTLVLISTDDLTSQKQKLRTPRKRSGSIRVIQVRARKSWLRSESEIIDHDIEKKKNVLSDEVLILEDLTSGHQDITHTLSSRTLVLKNVTSALRRSDTERAARMAVSLCFPRSHADVEFKTMRRACQCSSDDVALFQNCLSILLTDRDKLTLPVVTILISKVRLTFEVLGTEVLRGNVGAMLKHVTGNFGNKISHRDSTPGFNYRLQENAEECHQELIKIKNHVHKITAIDYSPELMALKKTLELFDF